MTISAVSSLTTTTETVTQNDTLDKEAFLSILSAQLQYQDPLEGGDNTEYVAQLAQFSALEQMENLNTSLEDLKLNQNLMYASLLIGKWVELTTDDQTVSGMVDRTMLSNGLLTVMVNDTEYEASQIVSMEGNAIQDLTDVLAQALYYEETAGEAATE